MEPNKAHVFMKTRAKSKGSQEAKTKKRKGRENERKGPLKYWLQCLFSNFATKTPHPIIIKIISLFL